MNTNKVYLVDYYGFVYIWRDNLKQKYYIGSHLGPTTDSYIGSNKWLQAAYRKRSHTFKRRILTYLTVSGITHKQTLALLHQLEQSWLNLIPDHELATTTNVTNGQFKYYNMKKTAAGGSHKGHTKNRLKPQWNKGLTKEMCQLKKQGLFCFLGDKPKTKSNRLIAHRGLPRTPRVKKQLFKHVCSVCSNEFTGNAQRQYCSRSCATKDLWTQGKAKANPRWVKGQEAWNKGKLNPTAAENGKKSAKKQSNTITGRRIFRLPDGRRVWVYPNDPAFDSLK